MPTRNADGRPRRRSTARPRRTLAGHTTLARAFPAWPHAARAPKSARIFSLRENVPAAMPRKAHVRRCVSRVETGSNRPPRRSFPHVVVNFCSTITSRSVDERSFSLGWMPFVTRLVPRPWPFPRARAPESRFRAGFGAQPGLRK